MPDPLNGGKASLISHIHIPGVNIKDMEVKIPP